MYEYFLAWIRQARSHGYVVGAVMPDCVTAPSPPCATYRISGDSSWKRTRRLAIVSSFLGVAPARRIKNELCHAVHDFKPDVIHFVDESYYSAYLLRGVLEVSTVPALYTMHDPVFHDDGIRLPQRLLKHRLRHAVGALTSTNAMAFLHVHDARLVADAPAILKRSKMVEIPHPLPRRLCCRLADVWKPGARPLIIGFLGRIERYKGLEHLFGALRILFDSRRVVPASIVVKIVGSGQISHWDGGLPCVVEVRNDYVPDAAFHATMADLDILVVPYNSATQSGVVAMGVSYGIPVLATDTGALKQFVKHGENGWLVGKDDTAEGLADVLGAVVSGNIVYSEVWQGASVFRDAYTVDYPEWLKCRR
jgi:glycosyltransferase involved in cell wall biosynthesis